MRSVIKRFEILRMNVVGKVKILTLLKFFCLFIDNYIFDYVGYVLTCFVLICFSMLWLANFETGIIFMIKYISKVARSVKNICIME